MIDEATRDALAMRLYAAYDPADNEPEDWEEFKRTFPYAAAAWFRVADAAVKAIVVVKIGGDDATAR